MMYENVVFLQGDEAEEVISILQERGEDEVMNHLINWHTGEGELTPDTQAGRRDKTYERGKYILSWNTVLGYIGLEYKVKAPRPEINKRYTGACR